jgi:hypothetical protein
MDYFIDECAHILPTLDRSFGAVFIWNIKAWAKYGWGEIDFWEFTLS